MHRRATEVCSEHDFASLVQATFRAAVGHAWIIYVIGRPVTRRRSSGFIAGIAADAVELSDHLRRQLDRGSTAA